MAFLGLRLLKNRNPQTDQNLTSEFHWNGRQYICWPVSPEEFIDGSPVMSCIPKDEKGRAIVTKPVMRHANIGESFATDPDSSQITIGVVIQQYFHNDGRPQLHLIAYMSKRFMEMESRYSIQEQLLAAKHALDRWRHIVERSEILTDTDHESFQTFHKKCITPCLVRFMQDIYHYIPAFTYRHGLLEKVLYASSRMFSLRRKEISLALNGFIRSTISSPPKPKLPRRKSEMTSLYIIFEKPCTTSPCSSISRRAPLRMIQMMSGRKNPYPTSYGMEFCTIWC